MHAHDIGRCLMRAASPPPSGNLAPQTAHAPVQESDSRRHSIRRQTRRDIAAGFRGKTQHKILEIVGSIGVPFLWTASSPRRRLRLVALVLWPLVIRASSVQDEAWQQRKPAGAAGEGRGGRWQHGADVGCRG
eukprot:scaffold1088_cov247-Pinguiococcus_pyrenoidosus.AAC.16